MKAITNSNRVDNCGMIDGSMVSGQSFRSFVESAAIGNRAIDVPAADGMEADTVVRYCGKTDSASFAISVAPATCRNGMTTYSPPEGDYFNLVQFIGYTASIPAESFSSMFSRFIDTLPPDRLLLVRTTDRELAERLAAMGFVRISGVRDRIMQYSYLPNAHRCPARQTVFSPPDDIPLDEGDRFYYTELQRLFEFGFVDLLRDGWTVYSREGRRFLFTVTFGRNRRLDQPAFRIDVFDCANGMFTAYNDVHIPGMSNIAFNDMPAVGFDSVVPDAARACLNDVAGVDSGKTEHVRSFWQNRDALWVHQENRGMGIAGTLERIACDICKYMFPEVLEMQVCVPFEHPDVYYFHRRNGAKEIGNGLYKLAYDIRGTERPLIRILGNNAKK